MRKHAIAIIGIAASFLNQVGAEGEEKKADPVSELGRAIELSADDKPAFAVFERDLLEDVIPAIEERYGTRSDREGRALAGLSMGGGQALNFGLGNLDVFSWVGAFSSAPNTKPPAELVPDPAAAKDKLNLLVVTCGNKDGLFRISKGVHAYLEENDVPHVRHVDDQGHDPNHWANAPHFFAQEIFH